MNEELFFEKFEDFYNYCLYPQTIPKEMDFKFTKVYDSKDILINYKIIFRKKIFYIYEPLILNFTFENKSFEKKIYNYEHLLNIFKKYNLEGHFINYKGKIISCYDFLKESIDYGKDYNIIENKEYKIH